MLWSSCLPNLIGRPLPHRGNARSLEDAWIDHWRSLWPECPVEERETLERLISLAHTHGATFSAARPEQGWELRLVFRRQLRSLFRRSAMQPAALFSYLALVATDLERLRGTLVNRAAYAGEF